jgi:hypothetical protein
MIDPRPRVSAEFAQHMGKSCDGAPIFRNVDLLEQRPL